MIRHLCGLSLLLACAACPALDEGLTATVLDAAPLALDPARDDADDLAIRVAYRDGDGNLGGGNGEIHDCRAEGLVTRLVLPLIANADAVAMGVAIEGELVLTASDVGVVEPDLAPPATCVEFGVTGTPAVDLTRFCVVLIDTAGDRAGDCTTEISIAVP